MEPENQMPTPLLKGGRDPRELRWFVYLAFLFPACAGFLFGFDIGAMSACISSLFEATHLGEAHDLRSATLHSTSLIGATLGSVLVFRVGEPLGRRRELMVGAALYFVGSLVSVATPAAAAFASVIVGRIIYGFGIAFSMHSAPVYISEMSPADVRGLLVSLKEAFIVGGITIGFGISAIAQNLEVLHKEDIFRVVWALPLILSPIIFFGMQAMPPSPRWLLLRYQRAKPSLEPSEWQHPLRAAALASLVRFRRGLPLEAVEAELNEICATLDTEVAEEGSYAELFRSPRALIAGLGLISLQQLTGQPSVLNYQEPIFEDAGFDPSFASTAAVIVGAAKLAATLCTVSIVDRFGRRPLLFIGIGMMLVALTLLTVGFQLASPDVGSGDGKEVHLAQGWPPVIIFALVLYVCGYQIGFGPITWLIISEVFPLRTRTRALSMAVVVNFGFNLGVTFALDPLEQWIDTLSPGRGPSYLFMIYAMFSVLSMLFVFKCVPETKGKSLEQIEAMLR